MLELQQISTERDEKRRRHDANRRNVCGFGLSRGLDVALGIGRGDFSRPFDIGDCDYLRSISGDFSDRGLPVR